MPPTERLNPSLRSPAVFLLAAALALPAAARATVGVAEITSKDGGTVTVFYPSSGEERPLKRGPFTLEVAWQGDKWLLPRFHSDRVLRACAAKCERLADLPGGGHGALLSPFPPGLSGILADLLKDPPGFDRSALPEVNRRIAAFFRKHLEKPK